MRKHAEVVEKIRRLKAESAPLSPQKLRHRMALVDGLTFESHPDLFECFRDVFDAVCAPEGIDFHPSREECELIGGENGRITFGGTLHFTASPGKEFAIISRELRFDQNAANHKRLQIHGPFRGYGLAAVLLENSMSTYLTCGIGVIGLQAGLIAGRSYWARFGFEFVDGNSGEEGERVRQWFARIVAALKLGVDCSTCRSPSEWLELGTDGDATCSLADIATAMPNAFSREDSERISTNTELDINDQIPLGRAGLITGRPWDGFIPVTRPVREQVRAYLVARGDRDLQAAVELHKSMQSNGEHRPSTKETD